MIFRPKSRITVDRLAIGTRSVAFGDHAILRLFRSTRGFSAQHSSGNSAVMFCSERMSLWGPNEL